MPGPRHDGVNNLIREDPGFALRVLRELGNISVLDGPARLASTELTDRISKPRQPDTVVLTGPPHDPWHAVIAEIETTLTQQGRWP